MIACPEKLIVKCEKICDKEINLTRKTLGCVEDIATAFKRMNDMRTFLRKETGNRNYWKHI